jgi:hypothetical protein
MLSPLPTTQGKIVFHTFLAFNSTNSQITVNTYDSNALNIVYTGYTSISSTWFNSLNYYWLASGNTPDPQIGSIGFDIAGWYNTALTPTEQVTEVNKSPT